MRIVAIVVLQACVPTGKYKALQAELDGVRAELSGQTAAGQSLQQALEAEKRRSSELQAEIEALEQRNALLLRDKSALDADVGQMRAALKELEERKAAADARIKEFQDLLAKFKSMIDSGKLKVKIVGGRMVVELASDILFPSGSAGLSPDGKTAILDVAKVLASIPDRSFQVEGHTDDVPIRTERFPSNWELGAARAITVVETLKEGGVPVDHLSAASYAENRPVAPNRTPEGKASNRRIEIVVVPDLSELPGYEELEKLAGQ